MTRPLRLAVDARNLVRDERGIGTYVRMLLRRFMHADDIVLTLLVRDWFPGRAARAVQAAVGSDADASNIRFANRVPRDADVMWHPWNGTFFSTAIGAVATIHDVVPFALPVTDLVRRRSQQAPFVRTARTAHAIVCDSRFTVAEVQRYLGVEHERLHAVELGVDRVFAPGEPLALPAPLHGRRYVLYVGAHDDHKNVMTLVEAHRATFQRGDVPLVFTRTNPLVPEALVFDRASIATLVALYRGALVVAVPSLYEGFGLPVLEAMACGAPVLASRAAALPEVGGDVIRYVDAPRDVRAWQLALEAICRDDAARATMARLGPLRASTFSWDRSAQRTLDIIRATAESRSSST